MDATKIEAQARAELDAENFREAVDAAKQRLRERDTRPWWKRLFPYRITVTRTD
jgi:hypothetical protein